jgi:hypothetical protein
MNILSSSIFRPEATFTATLINAASKWINIFHRDFMALPHYCAVKNTRDNDIVSDDKVTRSNYKDILHLAARNWADTFKKDNPSLF